MSNSIEHVIPEYVQELVGMEGGDPDQNTWFRISDIAGTGESEHHPSITPEGEQLRYDHPDYWKHKTTVLRTTIRLSVKGSAVSAESFIRERSETFGYDWKCLAISPRYVDLYPSQTLEKINK